MAIDKERAKQIRESASKSRIEAKASQLRMQWSANGNCLCSDWHQLAAKVGLSSADVEALQVWARSKGLREPRRSRLK